MAKKQSLGTHEGVIVGENSFHAVNTRVMEGPLEVEQFSYHSTHTPTEHSIEYSRGRPRAQIHLATPDGFSTDCHSF